jgi:hypothetical protein
MIVVCCSVINGVDMLNVSEQYHYCKESEQQLWPDDVGLISWIHCQTYESVICCAADSQFDYWNANLLCIHRYQHHL